MIAPVRLELSTFPAPTVRRSRVLLNSAIVITARALDPNDQPIAVSGFSFYVRRPDGLSVAGLAAEPIGAGQYRVAVACGMLGAWRVVAECNAPFPAAAAASWDCYEGGALPQPPASPVLVTEDLAPVVTDAGGFVTVERIPELPGADDVAGAVLIISQGGKSKHIPWSVLASAMSAPQLDLSSPRNSGLLALL